MCSVCLITPCHPRCPNAPEPTAVYRCCKCGGGIYEGDRYFDSMAGEICEDCLDGMDTAEWLEIMGEKLSTAEKEEI